MAEAGAVSRGQCNITVRFAVYERLLETATARGLRMQALLDEVLADLSAVQLPAPPKPRPIAPLSLHHARTRPPNLRLTSWLYELASRAARREVGSNGSDWKRAQVRSRHLHRLFAEHGIVIHEDGTRTP